MEIIKEREELILDAGLDITMECFAKRVEYIKETFNVDCIEIVKEFLDVMDKLFLEGIEYQKNKGKGPIQVIYISFLYSNFLLNRYGFQIDLFDKEFFLDEIEIINQWQPTFIFENLDNDIKVIEEEIKKSVLRLKKYELKEIKFGYVTNHYRFAESLVKVLVPYIKKLSSFKELIKENEVHVFVGEYMGEAIKLYEFKECEE